MYLSGAWTVLHGSSAASWHLCGAGRAESLLDSEQPRNGGNSGGNKTEYQCDRGQDVSSFNNSILICYIFVCPTMKQASF